MKAILKRKKKADPVKLLEKEIIKLRDEKFPDVPEYRIGRLYDHPESKLQKYYQGIENENN